MCGELSLLIAKHRNKDACVLLNAASQPRHTLVVVFCRQTFENYTVLFGPFLFFQGYFGGGGGGG